MKKLITLFVILAGMCYGEYFGFGIPRDNGTARNLTVSNLTIDGTASVNGTNILPLIFGQCTQDVLGAPSFNSGALLTGFSLTQFPNLSTSGRGSVIRFDTHLDYVSWQIPPRATNLTLLCAFGNLNAPATNVGVVFQTTFESASVGTNRMYSTAFTQTNYYSTTSNNFFEITYTVPDTARTNQYTCFSALISTNVNAVLPTNYFHIINATIQCGR